MARGHWLALMAIDCWVASGHWAALLVPWCLLYLGHWKCKKIRSEMQKQEPMPHNMLSIQLKKCNNAWALWQLPWLWHPMTGPLLVDLPLAPS